MYNRSGLSNKTQSLADFQITTSTFAQKVSYSYLPVLTYTQARLQDEECLPYHCLLFICPRPQKETQILSRKHSESVVELTCIPPWKGAFLNVWFLVVSILSTGGCGPFPWVQRSARSLGLAHLKSVEWT
jgi:hypothetical protein